MDAHSKAVFFQLCRAALRNFIPAGEIADVVLFGAQEAIAQHELRRLMEQMGHQLQELVERLENLEDDQSDNAAQERVIEAYAPGLLQQHKAQFGEVFHKLGKVSKSYDAKVREFGERFRDGEASEFLEETGLGAKFPHLSTEILRHLSGEGVLADLYEVVEPLDRGGMSQVFRAQRKDSHEWRAIKRFTPAGRGMLERFLIEGYVGKLFLDSEYLVSIFDFGGFLNSGDYFIECELLEGENLARWLRSNPYRGPKDVHLRLVGQMLEGLRYLHGQGFLHRDVKPANFFLTDDGRVKMLDFGIIKSLCHRISDISLTYTNQSLGTPAYKAPEQIDPARFGPISKKTDIYSLGVTMFELLTGQPLFCGSRMEVERQHVQELPQRPSQLNIALTPEIDDLVLACLAKDPARRPSLEEVVDLLPPPPALEERTGFLEALCWEGLHHRDEVVLQLQQITTAEVEHLGPVEGYIEKGRVHKLRERVLHQMNHRVESCRKLLWRVREGLAVWEPQRFRERCPNLLCGEERTRGSRSCSSCETDFNTMSCQRCGKLTSYFSERCQHGLCGDSITKERKLSFVVEITSQYAMTRPEDDAARAFLALSLLLSGQMQWDSDADSLKRMDSLRMRFAQANQIFQMEQLEEFRNALRKLVRESQEQYCQDQKAQSQDTLREVYWLIEEGRALDAHQELQKIPRLIWDRELCQLEESIGESLTLDELNEAQTLIIQTRPQEALHLLESLPYDSSRRQQLIERTLQLQRALKRGSPRPRREPTTLPMTSAIAFHHRVLPRVTTLFLAASFVLASGLAYHYLWTSPHPVMLQPTATILMVGQSAPPDKKVLRGGYPFVLMRNSRAPSLRLEPAFLPQNRNHTQSQDSSSGLPEPLSSSRLIHTKLSKQKKKSRQVLRMLRSLERKRRPLGRTQKQSKKRSHRCRPGALYVCRRQCLRRDRKGKCKRRRWRCFCKRRTPK